MTNLEIRETIRRMLHDWEHKPGVKAAALEQLRKREEQKQKEAARG